MPCARLFANLLHDFTLIAQAVCTGVCVCVCKCVCVCVCVCLCVCVREREVLCMRKQCVYE